MRKPAVRWDKHRQAWRSDVGPLGRSGRRTSVYFRSHDRSKAGERAANRELAAYLQNRDATEQAAVIKIENPTVCDLCQAYLAHCLDLVRTHDRAARTCQSHAERLGRWMNLADGTGQIYGSRRARSLTESDGKRLLSLLRKEGCGPLRVAGIWRSANAVLHWAAATISDRHPPRILDANPFAGLKLPTLPRQRRQLATRGEVAALLRQAWRSAAGRFAAWDRSTCLLVRVQYHCGTRPGELCAATWGDWTPQAWKDPQGHAWGLLVVAGKTTRATGKDRLILVPPALSRAIDRLRADAKATDHIWRREDRGGGGVWDAQSLSRWVLRRRTAAGLGPHVVLYGLRRSWYTEGVESGVTADQLGVAGGTSAQVITDVYVQRRVAALGETAIKVREGRRGRNIN